MHPHTCRNRRGRPRRIALAATLLIAAAAGSGLAEESVPVPIERVRVADARLSSAFDDGLLRSSTLKGLVETLQRSDVIVHISPAPAAQTAFGGDLHVVAAGAGVRYVRVRIRRDLPRSRIVAMIAHELQHAVEVAAAPRVVDEATLDDLYHEIGYRVGTHQHETAGAIRAAHQVLRELTRDRPSFN